MTLETTPSAAARLTAPHIVTELPGPRAQALIAENLAHCGIETGYTVIRAPLTRGLERVRSASGSEPFDIVLLDPPYDLPPDRALVGIDAVLAPDGLVVLEHARKQAAPVSSGRLVRVRQVQSGDSTVTLYVLRNF